jgi:hypothetical protein
MYHQEKRFNLPAQPCTFGTPPVEDSDFQFRQILAGQSYMEGDPLGVFMSQKVKLDLPEGKDRITYADFFSAFSKATGYSFVCEDFASHRKSCNAKDRFTGETTVHDIFYQLGTRPPYDYQFFIDMENKLIIGRTTDWPENHRNLVSQEYMNLLQKKLNSTGLDLDGYLDLNTLEGGQYIDWIYDNQELGLSDKFFQIRYPQLWMLYRSLSPQEKQAAQSDQGLPLATQDVKTVQPYIKTYLATKKKAESDSWNDLPAANQNEISADPELIQKMVLHITSTPQWINPKSRGVTAESMEALPKIKYQLTFEWESEGSILRTSPQVIEKLPVYSPAQEQQLYPQCFITKK